MKSEDTIRAAMLIDARKEVEAFARLMRPNRNPNFDTTVFTLALRERWSGLGQAFDGDGILLPRDFAVKCLRGIMSSIDAELTRLGVAVP